MSFFWLPLNSGIQYLQGTVCDNSESFLDNDSWKRVIRCSSVYVFLDKLFGHYWHLIFSVNLLSSFSAASSPLYNFSVMPLGINWLLIWNLVFAGGYRGNISGYGHLFLCFCCGCFIHSFSHKHGVWSRLRHAGCKLIKSSCIGLKEYTFLYLKVFQGFMLISGRKKKKEMKLTWKKHF